MSAADCGRRGSKGYRTTATVSAAATAMQSRCRKAATAAATKTVSGGGSAAQIERPPLAAMAMEAAAAATATTVATSAQCGRGSGPGIEWLRRPEEDARTGGGDSVAAALGSGKTCASRQRRQHPEAAVPRGETAAQRRQPQPAAATDGARRGNAREEARQTKSFWPGSSLASDVALVQHPPPLAVRHVADAQRCNVVRHVTGGS